MRLGANVWPLSLTDGRVGLKRSLSRTINTLLTLGIFLPSANHVVSVVHDPLVWVVTVDHVANVDFIVTQSIGDLRPIVHSLP